MRMSAKLLDTDVCIDVLRGRRGAPFEAADADSAGRVRATLSRRGEMIGAYDRPIAAQGLARRSRPRKRWKVIHTAISQRR